MKRLLSTLPCLLALVPALSSAQSVRFGGSLSTGLASQGTDQPAPVTVLPLRSSPLPTHGAGGFFLRPQLPEESDATPRWQNRVLTGLGGALIGMGVGFFASQVALSDWSEESGSHQVRRPLWAGIGGGLGFALGFSFPLSGGGGEPSAGGLRPGRTVITAEQIREISATDALEAVRALRPEWLIQRGQSALYDPEGDNIRAYLDEMAIGGIEALAEVSSRIIASIRFIDPARATARWGTGHTQGVIQVITVNRPSP